MIKYDLSFFESQCDKNAKIIICKDFGICEYEAHNNSDSQVRKYKIDGEVINDIEIEKCDYLVLNDTEKTAYFIELKGSDIHKAINQLENTYSLLKENLFDYQEFFRIVYRSGTHSVNDSKTIRWKEQKGRKNDRNVAIIKNKRLVENI